MSQSKSTVDEIRQRFDNDVDRFSNLEVGQAATIDSPLAMELIAQAAASTSPQARHVLDIGCGAGNYTLKLLQHLPGLDATLVDLSRPMLDRAQQRVSAATAGRVVTLQGDLREIGFGECQFDIILCASVLHHLRTDAQWESVFAKFHRCLRPQGSLWIFDLIEHNTAAIQNLMRARYGSYLERLKDAAYRDTVFSYVEREDTPRSLMYQIDLLRKTGFADVDILHKNSLFAAFGGRKADGAGQVRMANL